MQCKIKGKRIGENLRIGESEKDYLKGEKKKEKKERRII